MTAMHALMDISAGSAGWLVWLLWALVGIFAALFAGRLSTRRVLWADIVTGVAAAVIGGYLSVNFLGDTPLQLFLISIMGALFFAAAALYILARLIRR